ncbi:MAG: UTP--glucose-1-phosphate uridylyltransferase GalU [Kiritimatiellaeota bacterium]|nr:UTP--glucose-1-phosphate uridylyltransferase GalU [Kiritimatiellota bacterium]
MRIRKAVIPAAGFGTRFLPFTKAVPKELVPLIDKPTLQYVVEEAAESGITDILIVTSVGKDAIQNHFNPNFELETRLRETGKLELLSELEKINKLADIHYIHQQELNGLGGAILQAKSFVGDEPFAVLLGDTVTTSDAAPVISQLVSVFDEKDSPVVALERVPMEKVSRYGVIDGDDNGNGLHRVRKFVEKPSIEEAPSNLVIASRYVFTPDLFEFLENTKKGKGNEIQLTDAMSAMLNARAMYGFEFNGARHDIGNKLEFVKSTILFALRRDGLKQQITEFIKTLPL